MKNCVMFVTHTANNFIKYQIAKFMNELCDKPEYDFWILCNSNKNVKCKIKDNVINTHIFNEHVIKDNGYKMNTYYFEHPQGFYGHNFEYSFMSFYKNHPSYDFYWLIEWDVYNSGNWYDLFSYYDSNHKNVDLYTTHINYGESDGWQTNWLPLANYIWIKSFNLTKNNKCKCFNPIDRFSNKALQVLTDSYEKGDYGFYEVAMPSILINNGLTLKAFGKSTEYSKDNRFIDDFSDNHFEFINDVTVQYAHKYIYKHEMENGKIYHPVKSFPT